MRIGIVHTGSSPCRCAQALSLGLEALGHEFILVDSEDIDRKATELSRNCDLIVDHTDTYLGQGSLRPLVRKKLEEAGARIVGPDSEACFLADNKAAAKSSLAENGIPVPQGIVITGEDWQLPAWLAPPLIVKPAFEHMSRGLILVKTEAATYEAVADLLRRFRQPLLVEQFIPGRELAVSLLAGPDGIQVLPPLEWLPGNQDAILSESFKLTEPSEDRPDAVKARLSEALLAELTDYAVRAFRVLGLRDYARFDVRLLPSGAFYFMEANTTPSLETREALALSAQWTGMDYPALVDTLLTAARQRYTDTREPHGGELCIDLPFGTITLTIPSGVHRPPPASIDMAALLDVKPGEQVLELGCGCGFLSIAALKQGADHVTATDLDPQALECALINAGTNQVADRLSLLAGSWYEALTDSGKRRFHVIIATPPQTPGPYTFGPRYGGFDGTKHLFAIIDNAADHLERESGRIWLHVISLANPAATIARLKERFSDVRIVRETDRPFTAIEYNDLGAGLFGHLQKLRAVGRAEFSDIGEERYVFRNLILRASGVRKR